MVLALVSLHDELLATANLMAPVVLNVKTRRGLQAIRRDSRYSHEHPVARQAREYRRRRKHVSAAPARRRVRADWRRN